jgi:hypothetical protein
VSDQDKQPKVTPPIQARPVYRDDWTAPQAEHLDGGVEPARSRCAKLRGPARQMCYAALYRAST